MVAGSISRSLLQPAVFLGLPGLQRLERIVRQRVVAPAGDAEQRHLIRISLEKPVQIRVGQRAHLGVGGLPGGRRWLRRGALTPGEEGGCETDADKSRCPVSKHAGLYFPRGGRMQISERTIGDVVIVDVSGKITLGDGGDVALRGQDAQPDPAGQ